jgi:uncharacterized UBP type Zn finger protein
LQILVDNFAKESNFDFTREEGEFKQEIHEETKTYIKGDPLPLLALKINRFQDDGTKNSQMVSIPVNEIVDLKDLFENTSESSVKYRVKAVINHHGVSAKSGHYTADVKRENLAGKQHWFQCNDSQISNKLDKDVLKASTTSYCVILELCKEDAQAIE